MNYPNMDSAGNTAKHFNRSKSSIRRAITKYREMHNLPLKDTSDSYRIYSLDKNYFSIIDTAEKALFLNWIATDQYVYTKTNNLQIEISHVDLDIVEKFCKAIGTNKKPREIIKNKNTSNRTVTKAVKIDLFSRKIAFSMIELTFISPRATTLLSTLGTECGFGHVDSFVELTVRIRNVER